MFLYSFVKVFLTPTFLTNYWFSYDHVGILHEFFQVFTFKEKHKLMLVNLAKKVTTVTPADKKETDVKVYINLIFPLSVYIFRKI